VKRPAPLTFSIVNLLVAVPLYAAAAKEALALDGKPAVYCSVGKGSERHFDAEVKAHYGKKFKIVGLNDERGYTRSRATTKVIPQPLYESGQMVQGSVRVVFIVTDKGRVLEPFVLTSTNAKLNRTVLDIIMQWRGTPARLNDVPISVILAQDFTFAKRR